MGVFDAQHWPELFRRRRARNYVAGEGHKAYSEVKERAREGIDALDFEFGLARGPDSAFEVEDWVAVMP